jgi:uncharacterized membrane-anchored protein YhcB (DUF1043 family)
MTIKDVQTELQRLKENIDNAKSNLSKLEGREEELLNQLKKDFGVTSVAEADKKIKEMQKEYDKIEKHIEDEYKKLKDQYDW